MTDTISIIIPVYKVESYLRECLDSVLGQTYRALEILLVDDGSPDGCPAICDEYAARDDRVRVIHKPNGGLSDARNAGLEAAAGQWIGFVDSDDYIAADMMEKLHLAASRTGAGIAACGYRVVSGTGAAAPAGAGERELVLERDDAIRLLLEDKRLQNYVWNKLYRAEYWRDVRFPVGRAFEDIDTTWRLFDQAQNVVLIPETGYFYRVRSTGIVQSGQIRHEIDCVEQNLARYDALVGRFPECAAQMEGSILHAITKVWGLAWENRRLVRARYRPEMRRFAALARAWLPRHPEGKTLGITGRMTLRLLPYDSMPAYLAAHILRRLYRLRHPSPAEGRP